MSADLDPHSRKWYDRLAQMQEGYFYPWKSTLRARNGEDAYLALVEDHLFAGRDVLDVGCGHGEMTLAVARKCRSVLGYDRVEAYIRLAREAARSQGVENVAFACADSGRGPDRQPRIPAEDHSFDLMISRRGPLHWIRDARRVARRGAVLIQLHPMAGPVPEWNAEVPTKLKYEGSGRFAGSGSIKDVVLGNLAQAGIRLHSCWTFDVPEVFHEPVEFHTMLAWGRVPEQTPAFERVRHLLESIFRRHAGPDGLALRHRRFLWKAEVE